MPLAFCILEMGPVTHIDAPGCHALEELMEEFHKAGVQFVLSNPSASVIRSMERAALFDVLGREWVFVTMQDAVQFAQRMLEEKGYKVRASPSGLRALHPCGAPAWRRCACA